MRAFASESCACRLGSGGLRLGEQKREDEVDALSCSIRQAAPNIPGPSPVSHPAPTLCLNLGYRRHLICQTLEHSRTIPAASTPRQPHMPHGSCPHMRTHFHFQGAAAAAAAGAPRVRGTRGAAVRRGRLHLRARRGGWWCFGSCSLEGGGGLAHAESWALEADMCVTRIWDVVSRMFCRVQCACTRLAQPCLCDVTWCGLVA